MNKKVTSREEILEKALIIAKRDGVDQMSIRKLAKECNMAIGSMYNYYPDKQTLMSSVSENFWGTITENQNQLYREGMSFTIFLEQYYMFLNVKLADYDKSWLREMDVKTKRAAINLFRMAVQKDRRINKAIWNMELNEQIFCEYVLTNIIALLRAGETNCRFFVYLLEHLLYE